MSKTNCINCGAAKEVTEIKCPFCGTVYLDMTTIDFFHHTPVILKFIDPSRKKAAIVKAIPAMGEIKCDDISPYLVPRIDIEISFRGIDVIKA